MATAFATMLASSGLASGTAAGLASTVATVGSVGATVVGGLSEIFKANAQADVLEERALFADFEAKQELIKGKQDAVRARRALNENVGSIITRGAASGLTSSGSVDAAVKDANDNAQFDIGTIENNATISSGFRTQQANEFRSQADSTRGGGIFAALSHGLNFFSRSTARG